MKSKEIIIQARQFMANLQRKLQDSGFLTVLLLDRGILEFKSGNHLRDSEEFPELIYKNDDIIIGVWASPDGWDFGGIYYISVDNPDYIDFVLAAIKHTNEISQETGENIEIGIGFEYNK